jgi:hypothetical protein
MAGRFQASKSTGHDGSRSLFVLVALSVAALGVGASMLLRADDDATPPAPSASVSSGVALEEPPEAGRADGALARSTLGTRRPAVRPEARSCSARAPVCVHGSQWPRAAQLLSAAEDALFGLRSLGLPWPVADGGLGGGPELDLYEVDALAHESELAEVRLDAREPARWDHASAHVVLAPLDGSTCVARSVVTRAVGQASLLGLDAGMEPGLLTAASAQLATLAAPCPAVERAGMDAFQARPERALLPRSASVSAEVHGAHLFGSYLDEAVGSRGPCSMLWSLAAIATQRTRADSLAYATEPDAFDALRSSLRYRKSNLDDLLLDFAVARAFVGSRDDGRHLAEASRFGDEGRVAFEWSVPVSTLPRRVLPARPIEPSGMSYVWVDLAGAPRETAISLSVEWERPAHFRWAAVKVDAEGAEVGRIDVASVYGRFHADKTLVDLGGLAGLVLVGVHTGSALREHPLDPDEESEAHAYALTLYPGVF